MFEILSQYYLSLKALHIIAFTCWMAGMFYLPRLFVYHAAETPHSQAWQTFATMERRLLKIIMAPAMVLTFALGLALSLIPGVIHAASGWFHLKVTLVLLMAGLHGFFSKCHKRFVKGENQYSARFYRYMNEIPTLCFILIVFLVVIKPF